MKQSKSKVPSISEHKHYTADHFYNADETGYKSDSDDQNMDDFVDDGVFRDRKETRPKYSFGKRDCKGLSDAKEGANFMDGGIQFPINDEDFAGCLSKK